jgi:pimeloyl-ACP methyl ester carboxylesterase
MVLSGSTASYSGWGGFVTKLYGYVFPLLAKRLEPKSVESWRKMAPPEIADDMVDEGISMRAAAMAFRQIPGRDYRGLLASYPGPVMILNGERDRPNRDEEGELLAARPDAEIVTIEDAGHACSITRPDIFNAHVRRFARLHAVAPG